MLRDLLDTDGHQLVHVIKHDEAYGTMVTNVTAIEVPSGGLVVGFGFMETKRPTLPPKGENMVGLQQKWMNEEYTYIYIYI